MKHTNLNIVDAYIELKSNPNDGAWDVSASRNYAKRFISRLANKISNNWKASNDLPVQKPADLQALVTLKYAKRVWDIQGDAFYAKIDTPIPNKYFEFLPEIEYNENAKSLWAQAKKHLGIDDTDVYELLAHIARIDKIESNEDILCIVAESIYYLDGAKKANLKLNDYLLQQSKEIDTKLLNKTGHKELSGNALRVTDILNDYTQSN